MKYVLTGYNGTGSKTQERFDDWLYCKERKYYAIEA